MAAAARGRQDPSERHGFRSAQIYTPLLLPSLLSAGSVARPDSLALVPAVKARTAPLPVALIKLIINEFIYSQELGLDLDIVDEHGLKQMLHASAPWASIWYQVGWRTGGAGRWAPTCRGQVGSWVTQGQAGLVGRQLDALKQAQCQLVRSSFPCEGHPLPAHLPTCCFLPTCSWTRAMSPRAPWR